MKIEDTLNKIDELSKKISSLDQSVSELLKIVPYFRLDWGEEGGDFSNDYSVGATKPIILSGLANDKHSLKSNSLDFAKNGIANLLINAFVKQRKISKDFLLNLHGLIIKDGGNFRKEDVYSNYDSILTKAFTSPLNIEEETIQLIEWFNNEYENTNLHPVILSSLFHYNIVKIHPFQNGNGRLARILTSMILLQKNLPPPIMNQHDRISYITSMRNADSGDILSLIIFLGSKIIDSQMFLIKENLNA